MVSVYVDGKDISPSVRDLTINVQPFEDFAEAMKELERVTIEASRLMSWYGEVYFSYPVFGRRRHGLIKHLRDVKRAQMKREARYL